MVRSKRRKEEGDLEVVGDELLVVLDELGVVEELLDAAVRGDEVEGRGRVEVALEVLQELAELVGDHFSTILGLEGR